MKVGPTQQGCSRVDVARGDKVAVGAPLFTRTTRPTAPRAIRRRASCSRPRSSSPICRPARKPTEIQQAEANLADATATPRAHRGRSEARRVACATATPPSRASTSCGPTPLGAGQGAAARGGAGAARGADGPRRRDQAQEAAVAAARAALDMARWRLGQRRVVAPVAGRVADVLARPGETMAAGAPVVSLLPPAEHLRALLRAGDRCWRRSHRGDPVALAATGARAISRPSSRSSRRRPNTRRR